MGWVRFGSCLRRNDEGERGYGGGGEWVWRLGGAGMAVGGAARAIGARRDWCAGSWRLTPHLTSLLEGGRDELGTLPWKRGEG